MPISRRIDKEAVVHIHKEILRIVQCSIFLETISISGCGTILLDTLAFILLFKIRISEVWLQYDLDFLDV